MDKLSLKELIQIIKDYRDGKSTKNKDFIFEYEKYFRDNVDLLKEMPNKSMVVVKYHNEIAVLYDNRFGFYTYIEPYNTFCERNDMENEFNSNK